MDLFFVSQALKYTTATTQLLTDMADIPKFVTEKGVGLQEIPVVCIEPAGGPPTTGQPQFEACVLYGYDTTCADHNLRTPKTTEGKEQATECNDNPDTCKQCGGNPIAL